MESSSSKKLKLKWYMLAVALGWHHLVADQIAEGRLVRVGPPMHYRDDAYSLEYRPDSAAPETVQDILGWFRAEIAKTPPVPER